MQKIVCLKQRTKKNLRILFKPGDSLKENAISTGCKIPRSVHRTIFMKTGLRESACFSCSRRLSGMSAKRSPDNFHRPPIQRIGGSVFLFPAGGKQCFNVPLLFPGVGKAPLQKPAVFPYACRRYQALHFSTDAQSSEQQHARMEFF